tara:strand:- start:40 stop:1299 length:1260 start_codon:yes stop_codon:yes gene_type:complete
MAICNCTKISHSSWDFTAPTSTPPKVDDATIDDLSSKKVITVHAEIIKSKDKSKACSLKGLLGDLKEASWVKSDSTNINRVGELIDSICDNVIKTKCTCEEKLDDTHTCKDDKVIKAKKDCASPKVWSDSECKCNKKTAIKYVDGCIDPKATNYYCKTNKCGADNDTLPENMVTTQCEYEINKKLKYRYILSTINNPNPEDGINTWGPGPIVIKGTSSYDKPGDYSWLNKEYKDRKIYWAKKCSNISDTTINFSGEKGLYADQGDIDILNDLVNALTRFCYDYDDWRFFINKYKLMIMDDAGNNLGIISVLDGSLTLDNRKSSNSKVRNHDMIFYRASKNVGSTVFSNSPGSENAAASDFTYYFNNSKQNNKILSNVEVDNNYVISVKNSSVDESTIGLGTLLEIKGNPIIGLGSILNK